MARPKGKPNHHATEPKPERHKAGATGRWGTFEARSLGGMASHRERVLEAFFARRRAAWAAQVARILA